MRVLTTAAIYGVLATVLHDTAVAGSVLLFIANSLCLVC